MITNGTWTPEAIRALGPTTDLPTLGTIFKCSRWKSYQMARHGEWERVGIKVIPIGSKYRVVVQSIMDVLGYGRGDVGDRESPRRTRPPIQGETPSQPDARPAAAWHLEQRGRCFGASKPRIGRAGITHVTEDLVAKIAA